MNPSIEYRVSEGIEVRAAQGFLAVLKGIAAPFNSDSLPLRGEKGSFIERVMPGAFKRTLRQKPDVISYWAHNPEAPIARTPQTLSLAEQSAGLGFEMRLLDTSATRDVLENVRGGIVKGVSMGFIPVIENWTARGSTIIRELFDVELLEISPVANPAYPATTIAERAFAQFAEIRRAQPDVFEATAHRGRFTPARAVVPVEYREGQMVSVADFIATKPGTAFAAEIASELPGFVNERGELVVDGFELQKRYRDPECVKRAFDRICERSDEKFAEAMSVYESANSRRW